MDNAVLLALLIGVGVLLWYLMTKRRPAKPTGYVYIIGDTLHPRLYKIGRSNNPRRRLKELNGNTIVPGKRRFYLIHAIPCRNDRQAERILHARYHKKRSQGEWF